MEEAMSSSLQDSQKELETCLGQMQADLAMLRAEECSAVPAAPIRKVASLEKPPVVLKMRYSILAAFLSPFAVMVFFLIANAFRDQIYISTGLMPSAQAYLLIPVSLLWPALYSLVFFIRKRGERDRILASREYLEQLDDARRLQEQLQAAYDDEYRTSMHEYSTKTLPQYRSGQIKWKSAQMRKIKQIEQRIAEAESVLSDIRSRQECC